MSGRETILARIREGLRQPAPHPHASHHQGETATEPHEARDWLPPVGESLTQQIELFRKNAEALKATFHIFETQAAAAAALASLAAGWKTIAVHRSPLIEPLLPALQVSGIPWLYADDGYEKAGLAACDAGITTCECLVAQTGSVLVTSATSGGRALSVLPPHHIVIARRQQMLPDLEAAFAHLKTTHGNNPPSMVSFITGPSRTGDIERILVLGAHGPKELTIFLVD
ncbi:MAG: lactate utilization protein [Terrimicrobiaceae bacterium]